MAGLGLLAGCAVAPSAPPTPARMYRVGVLTPTAGAYPQLWVRMAELGYVEGQNLAREERVSRLLEFEDLAAELVGLRVDVILVTGPSTVRAAMAATSSIPIVMVGTSGVPGSGFVESLARPGGNVTGVIGARFDELDPKRLQLLVEAAPRISRVGLLPAPEGTLLGAVNAAAATLGIEVLGMPVTAATTPDGYEAAFEQAVAAGVDGILTQIGGVTNPNATLIASLALRHRLPGIYTLRAYVTSGGLMAYVPRADDIQRRAAEYVDRILRGARPADLPVEQVAYHDLVVNLRVARELGLALSPFFMIQVDEVIE
jgi:putative ABC transport system substrate-binding protein